MEGYVERIVGVTAYVRLRTEGGETLYGQYPADELAAKQITEGQRFSCLTIEDADTVRIEIAPIARNEISDDRLREIRDEIQQSIGELEEEE